MKKAGWLAVFFLIAAEMLAAQQADGTAATQKGPAEGARNMQRVGAATGSNGKIDLGPYSKLAPWPNTDGRYLYSGCYDPAPLMQNIPEADRCFMTINLKDPEKPVRLATVYSFDPINSPHRRRSTLYGRRSILFPTFR
jgi:hypothetical protein